MFAVLPVFYIARFLVRPTPGLLSLLMALCRYIHRQAPPHLVSPSLFTVALNLCFLAAPLLTSESRRGRGALPPGRGLRLQRLPPDLREVDVSRENLSSNQLLEPRKTN